MSGPPRAGRRQVLLGILRVALGRPDGLDCFGYTPQAFMISLAPMGGLLLAGLVQGLANGEGLGVLAAALAPLCALLAPPVLSHALALRWGREQFWLHYATAVNWCQLVLPFIGLVLLMLLAVAKVAGMPAQTASLLLALGLGGYAMWLHWFLARHGLRLSGGRSALLVLGVNFGTALLVFGPRLLVAARE